MDVESSPTLWKILGASTQTYFLTFIPCFNIFLKGSPNLNLYITLYNNHQSIRFYHTIPLWSECILKETTNIDVKMERMGLRLIHLQLSAPYLRIWLDYYFQIHTHPYIYIAQTDTQTRKIVYKSNAVTTSIIFLWNSTYYSDKKVWQFMIEDC